MSETDGTETTARERVADTLVEVADSETKTTITSDQVARRVGITSQQARTDIRRLADESTTLSIENIRAETVGTARWEVERK